ncbi:MAG: YfhO family protein [Oscillospiraceae bacterium]|nr:YfhO family protein [Oscillospiraceae bacterium]
MLSFLLPCIGMLLLFAAGGRYPFGSATALESDAAIQYYPFTLLLRNAVRGGHSLFYSWSGGLGINLWSTAAYYCTNLWSIVCIALPQTWIPLFLTLTICVRIGLAGLFFSVLLRAVRRELDFSAVIFSVLYAMNMWYLVNFYQLIWLDTVALTPLVLAGLMFLVRDGKPGLYTAALFFSLIFNPYMSWMTCLMTGLCWLILLTVLKKPVRTWPREAGRFLGHSLLAAGLGAVLLLPMAWTLHEYSAPGTGMPALTQTEFPLLQGFGRLVSFTYPFLHIGAPNLSGSMLGVLLLGGYLTERRIPLRERLLTAGLFLFLMLSLWYSPLSYLWHGFHTPHGFIHRFAHLVPLVLLFMGWRYTTAADDGSGSKKRLWQLIPMLLCSAAAAVLSQIYDTTDVVLVCAVLVMLYAGIYALRMLKPQKRTAFFALLLSVSLGETALNADLTAGTASPQFAADDLTPDANMQQAADAVRADAAAQGFAVYRTAMYPYRSYNPELLYDLPYGGSFYSSLIPDSLCVTCGALGMDSGSGLNYYFYQELPPVSMLLTGLQYVVMPNAKLPASCYRQLGDTWAYAFRYDALSGFLIPQTAAEMPEMTDRIAVQQVLFSAITGLDIPLYTALPAEYSAENGAEITKTGDHAYHCITGSEYETLTFSFSADADGWYVYFLNMDAGMTAGVKAYQITADDRPVISDNYWMGGAFAVSKFLEQIGALDAGQTVTVSLTVRPGTEGTVDVYAARQNDDAAEAGYQVLRQNAMTETARIDTEIRGTVTAEGDRLLYLPVPYESGWTAYVDGEKTDTCRVFGGMLGIRLSSGAHEIRLRFLPRGLIAGGIITLLSAVCAVFLCIRRRRKNQRS